MRLTTDEIQAITDCARKHFGAGCSVRLFGSRTDDLRRGGDIDLHIAAETAALADIENELAFLQELKGRIGEQKIDVIVRAPNYTRRAIDLIALHEGISIS